MSHEVNPNFACKSLLMTYIVVFMHSTQNLLNTSLACSILWYTLAKWWFFLFTMPFYWGVFEHVICLRILHHLKKSQKSFDIYSPLLSLPRHQNFLPTSFSPFSLIVSTKASKLSSNIIFTFLFIFPKLWQCLWFLFHEEYPYVP